MSRLPALKPHQLDDAQRKVHDSIAGARGSVGGPFPVLLANADLASRVEQLGAYLRYQCHVPHALRELAIITIAAFAKADYEWHAHAAIALKAGIAPGIVESIGLGQEPVFDDAAQALIHRFTRQLLEQQRPDEATFAAARAVLGEVGVLDLATLVGYYTLLAFVINTAEVDVPASSDIPWRRGA
jgi:4-carboxymuconolactone decarboxylase